MPEVVDNVIQTSPIDVRRGLYNVGIIPPPALPLVSQNKIVLVRPIANILSYSYAIRISSYQVDQQCSIILVEDYREI